MLLDTYAAAEQLCNMSVQGESGETGTFVFRGDMVIEDGEIADAQGRRLPPKSVVKQAVVTITNDKITMLVGALDSLALLPGFMAKYSKDLAEGAALLFYVSDLTKPMTVELEGFSISLMQHDEGAVWTMLMDDLRLEKSDFKGQSAEDKVLTMYEGLKDANFKFENLSFDDAQGFTVEIKREARGPV